MIAGSNAARGASFAVNVAHRSNSLQSSVTAALSPERRLDCPTACRALHSIGPGQRESASRLLLILF
jgi:hypothetical protein